MTALQQDVLDSAREPGVDRVRVAIIGAGFAGIGMAIRLRQEGEHDFVVLERADRGRRHLARQLLSGLRRRRRVPPLLLLLRAEPRLDAALLAAGGDLGLPAGGSSREHGLEDHARLGHEVVGADWDDEAGLWQRARPPRRRSTRSSSMSGMGPLTNPVPPQIPGLESFAGTCFHSARWDHDHDLTGRRVAVIGTGSSAAQFVPEIAPHVERLLVFQRTPAWVLPRMNRRITDRERRAYRRFPAAAARGARQADGQARAAGPRCCGHRGGRSSIELVAGTHLRRQVKDPALRAKLTPELPRRLQAADHRRRLVPGAHAPQRRRRHGRDHGDTAGGRRHRRRHRPRRRHADPRHGLRDHARGRPAARPRRRVAGRALGASTARPTSARRRRLPELLHARRAQHGDGPHLDPALRGGADRVRAAVPAARRAQRRAVDRGARRRRSTRSRRRSARSSRGRSGSSAAATPGTSTSAAAPRCSGRGSPGPSARRCAASTTSTTR